MQRFVLILLTLVLLGPLGIDIYLPLIPAIAVALDSPESLIQSTVALFILVMGLGQLLAGPLVDKYGRRPMALAGVVIYIIGAIIAALATSATLFILSRIFQGMAVCCTAVAIFSSVRDKLNGDDAARTYGFLNGTLNIVPALAPLLGGLLAEAFGWRAPFWFLAGYSILVLALIIRFLPETRPDSTLPVHGLPLRQYARLLSDRHFLGFASVNAGAMGMALTYVTFSPVVLMNQAQLTPLEFSIAFGANGFWIMLVSFFANRIIRKVGRPRCLAIGSLLMGAGFLSLLGGVALLPEAMQDTWPTYMLPVALACAGLAFLIGPSTSYALEPYPNEAGIASAMVGFVQMAGGAVLGLGAMAIPLPSKISLALVMLCAALLAIRARLLTRHHKSSITSLPRA
ncbi:multidrug effflux MFS transporter [Pectobacterium atrosepticum]|uniref:multidrug effflux MFS transporter n=1 Tax=Pectobacterium atrosepticum TaxID=29471 RepID=UPI00039BA5F1|nr:multidrug effflux MFS transporter [Pectobacterium atrosepticum]GKV85312.1 Bcr/CflA family drug resistance efflux transporter [Pectobacterium carotovorum subsp. carotovorum]ATY90844.1 Bcr/CflA family drug resistance efflux transporter [Pectobacterium atrosepticum]KFX14064.1 MFS transporter [Pectobacterium atrosepticum]KFX25602.1 MFS transporter [Pectobacterium atrosepticum]KMK78995.1 transport protein [Pectobacterium atrosepticum ICMP 1526]